MRAGCRAPSIRGACRCLLAARALPRRRRRNPCGNSGSAWAQSPFEDYRGSDTTHAYPLPVPYFVYNGKFLKADRDGVRGTLFNQDWFEINLSFNLTTPVRNDRERSGMPDLASTVELGPSFDFHLFRSDDAQGQARFAHAAARGSDGRSLAPLIGWTFTPRLNLDIADPLGLRGLESRTLWPVRCSPIAAIMNISTRSHRSMRRRRARNIQAPGAMPARSLMAALSKRFPKFWVGAYMRYDTLAGAAFIDSPLVQRKSYWSGGFGFAWMIRKSSQAGRSSRLSAAPMPRLLQNHL